MQLLSETELQLGHYSALGYGDCRTLGVVSVGLWDFLRHISESVSLLVKS